MLITIFPLPLALDTSHNFGCWCEKRIIIIHQNEGLGKEKNEWIEHRNKKKRRKGNKESSLSSEHSRKAPQTNTWCNAKCSSLHSSLRVRTGAFTSRTGFSGGPAGASSPSKSTTARRTMPVGKIVSCGTVYAGGPGLRNCHRGGDGFLATWRSKTNTRLVLGSFFLASQTGSSVINCVSSGNSRSSTSEFAVSLSISLRPKRALSSWSLARLGRNFELWTFLAFEAILFESFLSLEKLKVKLGGGCVFVRFQETPWHGMA